MTGLLAALGVAVVVENIFYLENFHYIMFIIICFVCILAVKWMPKIIPRAAIALG